MSKVTVSACTKILQNQLEGKGGIVVNHPTRVRAQQDRPGHLDTWHPRGQFLLRAPDRRELEGPDITVVEVDTGLSYLICVFLNTSAYNFFFFIE